MDPIYCGTPFPPFGPFGPGGGFPGAGYPGGYPGSFGPSFPGFGSPGGPFPYNYGVGHGNLPDATVGQHGFLFPQDTRGYAVDLNNNGRYDRGQDGVLGMDLNHDGRVDNREIEQTNQRMKAFGGNYDLNGDGKVNFCERIQGRQMQQEMQGYDRNHDGRLDTNEFASAGGRVLIDHNRDGQFGRGEQYSPYSFPTPGFGAGSLGSVDPRFGTSVTGHTAWGWGY